MPGVDIFEEPSCCLGVQNVQAKYIISQQFRGFLPGFLLSFSFSVFFPCNVLSFFLSLLLVFVLALLGIFLAFLAPIPFLEKSSCHVPSLPFPLANFLDGLSGPRLEADLPPC